MKNVHWLDSSFASLTPPEPITVADWCEKNIVLSELTCPEPGPFRIARTPYVRGPLDAFQSPYVEHIVYVWGRQLAKSTSIYNCLAYSVAQDPGPVLFFLPSLKLAKYTSKDRVQPVLDACPEITQKRTKNPDDYTMLEMKFRDCVISMTGGGAESEVMSRPVRYLFRDEIDALKPTVGQGGTDPLQSSVETTSNFGNRKIIDTSTPSVPQGNVWKQLQSCQRVFEYWVPCPECGGYQILVWERIKFPKEDRDPESVSLVAWYECEHCQAHIRNVQKSKMLEEGAWLARLTPDPCNDILKNVPVSISETESLDDTLRDPRIKKIGFHLPKWYSPFPNATFGNAAKEFLMAQGDFQKMKDWTKFWSARPWVERVKTKSYEEILANKIDLPALICPADTVVLTCSIDPGQGGFWFVVIAWQVSGNRHVVHYGFLQSWQALSELCFENTYEVAGTAGGRLRIWRIGIDCGGSKYDEQQTMTDAAYDWIRRSCRSNVFGVKGTSSPMRRRLLPTIADKMPGSKQPIPGSLVWWRIDTEAFKDSIQYHLGIMAGDPGQLTFHADTKEDLASHILSEERRRNDKGVYGWVKIRGQNHWLDCLVYGFALADPECQGGYRVMPPPVFPKKKPEEEEKASHWLEGIEAIGVRR